MKISSDLKYVQQAYCLFSVKMATFQDLVEFSFSYFAKNQTVHAVNPAKFGWARAAHHKVLHSVCFIMGILYCVMLHLYCVILYCTIFYIVSYSETFVCEYSGQLE